MLVAASSGPTPSGALSVRTHAAFVELARVDRAKALLETSDWPLARAAERAGFGSLDALHRAFLRRLNATPGEYRQRFNAVSRRV
ncbi:helix-turn-helix domain-containing protein [Phenylobacterium sp.]|uniref:helix-turn-helix domain-containing protein n=1 Tax=Phenylobacterium sp. TaxID=1871053 RepID=UPI002FC94EF4